MASVVVRMNDNSRKAMVNLPGTLTVGQLVETTQQNWNLPSNANYQLSLERTNQQLDPSASLDASGVQENDVLVVLPAIVGGG